ncbi:MAG: diphthamide biosynthesis enzyme Dph2, partial [Candidatus Methanomethylicaceae archaeon]
IKIECLVSRGSNLSETLPYDLEIERVIAEVKSRGVKSVIIQAPDGLKPYVKDLWEALSSFGVTVYISTDPCYGACSLADDFGKMLGAELLIHIGHRRFITTREEIPTLYVPAYYTGDVGELVIRSAKFLTSKGIKRVGLVASLQHIQSLRDFLEGLRSSGLEVVVDEVSGGVVLGCNVEAAKRIACSVNAILHVGGGDFHALGVALAVDKPVYIADPYRNEVREIESLKRKILARQWWLVNEAINAKTFGIVVVGKTGQFNRDLALYIKRELESKGRRAVMLVADEVNWERLSCFTFVDVFIITGCPRISLDNQESFGKPVLNGEDARELLKVMDK